MLIKPDYYILKVRLYEDVYYQKYGLSELNILKVDDFLDYVNKAENIKLLDSKKITITSIHFIEKKIRINTSKEFSVFIEKFQGKIILNDIQPFFDVKDYSEKLLFQLKESSRNFVTKKFKEVRLISFEELKITESINNEPKTFHEVLKENFIENKFIFDDKGLVIFNKKYNFNWEVIE